jgi:hypothetical protein
LLGRQQRSGGGSEQRNLVDGDYSNGVLTYVKDKDHRGGCSSWCEELRMIGMMEYPVSVVSAKGFARDAAGCLTILEIERLEDFLACNPEAGDVIPGTGEVRKVRWRYADRGKRGGCRVIYYFRDLNMPLFVLVLYKKGEKPTFLRGTRRQCKT